MSSVRQPWPRRGGLLPGLRYGSVLPRGEWNQRGRETVEIGSFSRAIPPHPGSPISAG